MRTIGSLLLIILTGLNAYGQDEESTAFLYYFFGKSATITYVNSLPESEIEYIKEALSRRVVYELRAKYGEPNYRLVLTWRERRYIRHALRLQRKLSWPDQLFENGKRLTELDVRGIFSDRAYGWTRFREQYGQQLYRFSKPIFIRAHSLCIFYSSYECGSLCGEGKLMILKKESNTWIPFMDIYQWIS